MYISINSVPLLSFPRFPVIPALPPVIPVETGIQSPLLSFLCRQESRNILIKFIQIFLDPCLRRNDGRGLGSCWSLSLPLTTQGQASAGAGMREWRKGR